MLLLATLIAAPNCFAQQVLQKAKLTSCNEKACTKLVSPEIHRSTISPNIMAFGEVTLDVFDVSGATKPAQSFKAQDGYYDMEEQIIILRDLRGSKHKELIYNLTNNSIEYY